MKNILAIETALEACGVSVATGDQCHTIFEPMKRGQTERLIPMVMEACEGVNITLKDVEAVCVTRGPGSFTGVRVGLSVARTLANIREIPLYGLTSFEALSLFMEGKSSYGIVLESKRTDVYFQAIVDGQAQEPCVTTYESLLETYPDLELIGNVAPLQFDQKALTVKMIEYVQSGQAEEGQISPYYCREADISASKKKYRTMSSDVLDSLL